MEALNLLNFGKSKVSLVGTCWYCCVQLRRSSSASPRPDMALWVPFLRQIQVFCSWTLQFFEFLCHILQETFQHHWLQSPDRSFVAITPNRWDGSGRGATKKRQNARFSSLDFIIFQLFFSFIYFFLFFLQTALEHYGPHSADWSSLSPQYLDQKWAWSIKKVLFGAWT